MDKPLTVAAAEFSDAVLCAVRGSGLPAFIIASTLTEIATSARNLAQQQLQADNQAWQDYLEKQNDESDS